MYPSPEDAPLVDPMEQAREDWDLQSRADRIQELSDDDERNGKTDPEVWEKFGEFVAVLEKDRDRLEASAKTYGGAFPEYMRCSRVLSDTLAALRRVDDYLFETAVDYGVVSWGD